MRININKGMKYIKPQYINIQMTPGKKLILKRMDECLKKLKPIEKEMNKILVNFKTWGFISHQSQINAFRTSFEYRKLYKKEKVLVDKYFRLKKKIWNADLEFRNKIRGVK
jgi:hypothetical protein